MKKRLELKDICEILLSRKVISAEQKSLILAKQHEQGKKLKKLSGLKSDQEQFTITPVDIIVSLNLLDSRAGNGPVTEEAVMRELAGALGIPFKKIDPLELDLDIVTRTVSRAFAIKNLAVPVAVENGELLVAMVDPLNQEVLEDISNIQKLKVVPVLSTKSDIIKLIREFYGFKKSIVMAERELVTPLIDIGNLEQYAKLGTVSEIESTDKYIQNGGALHHPFHAAGGVPCGCFPG